MSNDLQVPDYLKQHAGVADDSTASMASASNSVPRVSLRGRTFRFMENGEEVFKSNEPVKVIILGVDPPAGRMIKTFYDKAYQSGSKEPPTCGSDDGIAPAPWVTKKQSARCDSCPKNAFGSATSPSGKATKACRDSKRLWLVRENDKTGTLFGLTATVSSLKALSEYGRKLKANNIPLPLAITQLSMVDAEYPQLEFQCVGFVTQEECTPMIERANAKEWAMFSNAGLALSAPETGPTTALPMAAPAVPDHIKQSAKNVDVDQLTQNW
jgi:hypothetical protein